MIKVVFENQNLVALDKPGGVLAVPSRMQEKDTRPVLGLILQQELGIQIFPVHRLDFEVSGLILYAKNSESHKVMNRWFENHTVLKTYQALSERTNAAPPNEGDRFEWKCKLLRGKKRAYESPAGKVSITLAEVLRVTETQIQWSLNPVTGRSHQLRYELYRHESPIVGDDLYGAKSSYLGEGIALRCVKMKFPEQEAEKIGLPPCLEVPGLI